MIHKIQRRSKLFVSASLSVFLAGCGMPDYAPSQLHLSQEDAGVVGSVSKGDKPAVVATQNNIPALVQSSIAAPTAADKDETFDVIATNVPLRDVLFAFGRDAGINMDIDPRIEGLVSINAFDQPLEAILKRLQQQVSFRISRIGGALVIGPDVPYYQRYDVSFISIERSYSSSASTGSIGESGSSSISNNAENDFWAGIEEAVENILTTTESKPAAADGEDEEAGEEDGPEPFFNLNRNAGLLLVYASDKVQREVAAYLDKVLDIAKRQVLLEATIVEVQLNNQYAQGVDWSLFNSLASEGFAAYQGGILGGPVAALSELTRVLTYTLFTETTVASGTEAGSRATAEAEARRQINFQVRNIRENIIGDRGVENSYTPPTLEFVANPAPPNAPDDYIPTGRWVLSGGEIEANIVNQTSTEQRAGGLSPLRPNPDNFITGVYRHGDISAAVQLLDRFGDTKVLSSPRLSALNNQPALLRVGTQEIYFSIDVDEDVNADTGRVTERTFQIEPRTVDTGFSMNVLPYIDDDGRIILNLRPAVNRLIGYVNAPTPTNLGGGSAAVQNRIPILAQREMETIISLNDGEIAVLGGLLEERTSDDSNSVPGVSELPGVGELFKKKNQQTTKTEFIVFIKARIIKDPSVRGDYSDFVKLLPNDTFFDRDGEEGDVPPPREERQ